MKVVERFNVSKPPEGPRTFTFQLSGAGVASVVVVGTLCLIWVFILGVLVGRGYKPEAAVPELAQMMPSAPAPAQPEQKEPPTVLKPEELQFMENLQGKKPTETVTVDSSKKPGDKPAPDQGGASPALPPTSSLEKTPAPLPKGQVATAAAQPDRKTVASDPRGKDKAPAAKEPPKSPKDKAKEKDAAKDKPKDAPKAKDKDKDKDKTKDTAKNKDQASKKYKTVFQIAAIEDRKQAEREADRLTKKGLNSHVEEATVDGKTVYRVILRIRGTETDIKSTLDEAGVKKPIQREKKPL